MVIELAYFQERWGYYTNSILREQMIKKKKVSISITVKFFADLRQYGPYKENIEVPRGSTIKTILQQYKVPVPKQKVIILVNGIPHIPKNYRVKEGDIVAIFPPIAGG